MVTARALIESEFESIERELEFVLLENEKRLVGRFDEVDVRAVALALATIYNGIEKTLVTIAKANQLSIPAGLRWHVDLLNLANDSGLLSDELRDELKKFTAFRHFVRHAYSFELSTETVETVMDLVRDVVTRFKNEIESHLE